MKRKYLALILLGLVGFVGLTGKAVAQEGEKKQEEEKKAFGIAISPSVVRLKAKPGESQQATVRVFNNGISPAKVVTEMSDVGNRVDEAGNLNREFLPAGTLPFSCAKWTLLRAGEIPLVPEAFQDVTFLISPPSDFSGGAACVVFFRAIPSVEEKKEGQPFETQASIMVQPRLGALIFYEIEGTVQRTGSLVDLRHEPPGGAEPLRIYYTFKNTGNADLLVSGTFYILDENKALVAKGDLQPIRTFPGDQGAGKTEWTSSLGPGRYNMVITFELGPDIQEVIVKELEFTVA